MRIKTRIQLGIILSLVLAATIGLLLFLAARTVNEASRLDGIASEVAKGMGELKIVTHEYLLHPEERSLMQWRSRYGSLSEILTGGHFKRTDEKNVADQILKNLERFKTVFSGLTTGLRKEEALGKQESAAFRELQDRLMGELLVKSQAAVSLAFQLHQEIEAKSVTTQKRVSLLTILLLLTLTAAIVGISLWVNRSVARPIAKLEKDTRIIGSGNLDHKVGTTAKDEIGQLSRAFDKMTGDLKETTTSIVDLNKEIDERKQAEEELRKSEERFRSLFEQTAEAVFVHDLSGHIKDVNSEACKIWGYDRSEFLDLCVEDLDPDASERGDKEILWDQLEEKAPILFEARNRRKEGQLFPVEVSLSPIQFGGQRLVLAIARDISERKQAEKARLKDQIQQTHKMEAIATLAGGVAHEFNNALMGIMGNIELLKIDLPEDEGRNRYFEAMKSSGHRMSRLTAQLLAYAEGGKYQPKDLKLDDFVIETLPILQHDLNPKVRVETLFPKNISYIKADYAQMQMVLSAILTNSNEAIEDEGIIKITVGNDDVDVDFAEQHPGLKPGLYVCLTVEDDGKGMDEETRNGIFEPFFTTKFQGRGMGMAATYGIVINHDGWISVDSELGKGTVVQIHLPAIEIEVEKPKKAKVEVATGSGTILMIEDEEVVIEVTQAMLEMLGYRVMVAKTGKDAIHIAEIFDGDIDLALLDIKLPDMEGGKVYPFIMEARPNLKVIVCSGYSIEGPARKILDAGAQDFIQKPFSLATLSEKLKEVLEGK